MDNLKRFFSYHIYEYSLKTRNVELATGIELNKLERFPANKYTGPSLKELCELLSVDEAEVYSNYKYLPNDFLEFLFDYRIMNFMIWLYRLDSKPKSEILRILEDLQEAELKEPSQPEEPSVNTRNE